MKEKIKQHFAKICSNYPQRNNTFWIIIIGLQMLCFTAPLIMVQEKQSQSTSTPLSSLVQWTMTALSFATLARGLTEFLFNLLLAICPLLLAIILVHFYVRANYRPLTSLYEFMPVYLPIIIWLNSLAIANSKIEHAQISGLFIFLFTIIWCVRVLCLQPTCLNPNRCLNKNREIAHVLAFTSICLMSFIIDGTLFFIVALILHLGLLIWNTFSFGFIFSEIEYVRIMGFTYCIFLSLVELIKIALDIKSVDIKFMLLVMFVICERMGFVKVWWDFRYERLFKRKVKELTTEEEIATLNLLLEKKPDDQNGFLLYTKALASCLGIQIGRTKQALILYIQTRFLSTKQQIYGQLLVCLHISCLNFSKAGLCNSILNTLPSNFIDKIEIKTLGLALANCQRWRQKVRGSTRSWHCPLVIHRSQSFDVQKVLRKEKFIKKFMKNILECIAINNSLIKKLLLSHSTEEEIICMLNKQSQLKAKIQNNMNLFPDIRQSYQGLFAYYLFLNVCRSRKFSIMVQIGKYFEALLFAQHKRFLEAETSRFLVCLVSGQDESIGSIINANSLMKQTYNLSQDRIIHKSLSVNEIMPKAVGCNHNSAILKFKKSGETNFLFQQKNLLTIAGRNIMRMNSFVKIAVLNQGLAFAASMMPFNKSGEYALFNQNGDIKQCSGAMKQYLDWKTLPNIHGISTQIVIPSISMKFDADFPQQSKFAFLNDHQQCKVELYQQPVSFNYIGVCKFLRPHDNQNLNSFDNTKKSSNQQVQKNGLKDHTKEDKKMSDLQRRLSKLQPQVKMMPYIQCSSLLFWVIACVGLYTLYFYSQSINESIKATAAASGYIIKMTKIRSAELVSSLILLKATYDGQDINQNSGLNYGITQYSNFVGKECVKQLKDDTIEAFTMIVRLSEKMPINITKVLVLDKIYGQYSVIDLQLDFMSDISFKSTVYTETQSFSKQTFTSLWDIIYARLNYVQYRLSYDMDNGYDSKQQFAITTTISRLYLSFKVQVIVFMGLSVTFAALYLACFYKLLGFGQYFIDLIDYLDRNFFEAKAAKNAQAETVLKLVEQYFIQQMNFSAGSSRSFVTVNTGDYAFSLRNGNILLNEEARIQYLNSSRKGKRSIKQRSFYQKEPIGWVPMILFSILLLGFYAREYKSTDIYEEHLNTFLSIQSSLSDLQLTYSSFLNIIQSRHFLKKPNVIIMSVPADDYFEKMKHNLYKREFQSQISKDTNWKDVVEGMYKPLCDFQDNICRTVLKGSLLNGWPSTVIQFSTSMAEIYEAVKNLNQSDSLFRSFLSDQIVELQLTYSLYIRPLITKYKYINQEVLQKNLDNENKNKSQIFIIPVLLFAMMPVLHWIYYRRLKGIITEILTFDTVDFLSKNMHFSFELSKH